MSLVISIRWYISSADSSKKYQVLIATQKRTQKISFFIIHTITGISYLFFSLNTILLKALSIYPTIREKTHRPNMGFTKSNRCSDLGSLLLIGKYKLLMGGRVKCQFKRGSLNSAVLQIQQAVHQAYEKTCQADYISAIKYKTKFEKYKFHYEFFTFRNSFGISFIFFRIKVFW